MANIREQHDIALDSAALKALRTNRLWTQEDLAAAADVSGRSVQRAEAAMPISIETLRALAAALDVPPARLLGPKRMPLGAKVGILGGLLGAGAGYVSANLGIWA